MAGYGNEGPVFLLAGADHADEGKVVAHEPEIAAMTAGTREFGLLGKRPSCVGLKKML